jgi:hypothetical protein
MAEGTQLWETNLSTILKNIQSKVSDKVEDIQDVPFWKKAAKFIAPFAISALLPGIGTALTGLSGAGSGVLGMLGKGLSMGKATGIKSFLHGLLAKGGAQAALGGGFRSLIDSDEKVNLKDLNLSKLGKLYARDAVKKINKDLGRERKQSKENYLLADLISAGSSLIPTNPMDIFKGEPGYQWGATPSFKQAYTGSINPATNQKYDSMLDAYKRESYKGIQGKKKSIAELISSVDESGGRVADLVAPKSNIVDSFIPKANYRRQNILQGLEALTSRVGYEELYFQGDDPKQNPVTLIEELFRKNR